MASPLLNLTKKRNLAIDTLAILFGIGAWVAVNGMWVELPILVQKLPEQWSLPSYMTIVIQTANIGVILYGVLHKLWPNKVNETSTIIFIMTIGSVATLLMVFYWDTTGIIGGKMHSVGLLTLVFFISLVDCTSSVVFIPFMATFTETYIISYFVGEGFSGFFPSIVALAQGVGGNPDCVNMSVINITNNHTDYIITQYTPDPGFSVEIFFYILFAMMLTSFVAFLILKFYPWAHRWYASFNLMRAKHLSEKSPLESSSTSYLGSTSYQSVTESGTDKKQYQSSSTESAPNHKRISPKFERLTFYMTTLTWINFLMNGVLMSIQSYSCLPYGNLTYHLVVTISNAANPLACFLAFFIPNQKMIMIVIITIIGSLTGVYILVLAVLSPNPPLVGTTAGSTLIILAWVLITGLLSHTKTSIAMLLHEKGTRALFWYGNATQIGSFIGSLLMFLLVNVYEFFESYNPCI